MSVENIIIGKDNAEKFKTEVLNWLHDDYQTRDCPEGHFWHNREQIENGFDSENAMVAVLNNTEVVGFMIWDKYNHRAQLDIAEVKEEHRRKGYCKGMITELLTRFPDISLLTAISIEGTEDVFRASGWNQFKAPRESRFYKILKESSIPLCECPGGNAIALYSRVDSTDDKKHVDFYTVQRNPGDFKMKYFPFDLNEDASLKTPLVVPFHHEGYIGLYHNGTLIKEGKEKYLFSETSLHPDLNLFVMHEFSPIDRDIMEAFLPKVEKDNNIKKIRIED